MFTTGISDGKSCFAIVDFPEPAGPAKNIALGLFIASFKRVSSLITDGFCYKYIKKGLDYQAF
jgi:hypothetical protein